MAQRCAILDDYQNVALKLADWSKLSGDVEVEVAGVSYALSAGDSISIQRNAPHRAVNVGRHSAEILMVISPADTF